MIPIGGRRKPQPRGSPGYLRIDTVHQGDQDGRKGIYHINAVDEVTQWEIVAATPQISELWLIPLLETMLQQFPFVIRGFQSDNGSEFINYTVAKLLGKLLIEQTKSRAHRSGDNGLVEAKNGAVIRKHLGFGHIGAPHAEAVDAFHRQYLNPYVNFHRPCAVPKLSSSPTENAAASICVGLRRSSCCRKRPTAKASCTRRCRWPNSSSLPRDNPTPKPLCKCNAPNVNS